MEQLQTYIILQCDVNHCINYRKVFILRVMLK
jgi:hypothetical protein